MIPDDEKNWYESRTVWGSVAAILAGVGAAFGVDFDGSLQEDLTEVLFSLASTVGGALALIGRFTATSRLK